MTADELLAQLRGSKTDLGRFVEAMRRAQRPHLVVPTTAGRAWQEREPRTWAMVCDWLAERGRSVVQVKASGRRGPRSRPLRPTPTYTPRADASVRPGMS